MRTLQDIEKLLDRLETTVADELEAQDLDFKEWDAKSRRQAVATAVEMAVCMANGGGGTTVFGVRDRVLGRGQAILGVPYDVDALVRLRIVNRSNLGIPRMFRAFLVEGKEPPVIAAHGDSVTVTFRPSPFSLAVRLFVEDEFRSGREVGVDPLLIVHHLLRHDKIDVATAARVCQRSEDEAFRALDEMRGRGYLEREGTGPAAVWGLVGKLIVRLTEKGWRYRWQVAKSRVLGTLQERSERGEPGLSNQEIREMTNLNRNQVYRLMTELRSEVSQLDVDGAGRWARYYYRRP